MRFEHAGGMLERLVYVSRAATSLDTAAVYAIIRHAHAGNVVSPGGSLSALALPAVG